MSIDITTLALAKEYTNRMVGSGGTGGGVNGKDGITPHIGDNGNWFIGTVDTGISAQGPAGENGVTPHIGTNGNWYIGSVNTGVSAKGAKGDNGLDGNGIKSAILNSDYTLTLTFDNGTTYTTPSIRGATGDAGSAGKNGTDGKDGSDGVGIASIKQTTTSTADGGNNVFTVTLTNGTTATFTVKNGSKGSTGKDGSNGVDGGHYTPVVTQPTTDTMQISFAPSKSDMPAVNPVTVNLPVSENSGQNATNVFAGKTAIFFGDSLTEQNYHYTKGYHAWVKEILGLASYNNYGKSGYKVSDVYNKVKIVTDSADIVFAMCGVNDQNFSVPLGAMGDTTTGTTYGALKLLCEKLKEKYPTSIIVFVTPAYQTKYPHSSGVTSYEVSKAIREVCALYAIPVYDNFSLSGIYNTNLSVFTTDNCHWNNTAHEMVGKNLARFVSDSFRYVYGATSGGNGGNGGDSGGGEEDGDTTEPVTGVTMGIINNSVGSASYEGDTLTLTGLNQTYGGVLFDGATSLSIDAASNAFTSNAGFGWFIARDGDIYHAIGTIAGKIETYEFSSTLTNPSNRAAPGGSYPANGEIALAIEGESVNMYFDGVLAYTTTGDAIGYARSEMKSAVLYGLVFDGQYADITILQ